MKLDEVKPGQLLQHVASGEGYVFVGAITPHPLYEKCSLTIWWKMGVGYQLLPIDPETELDYVKPVKEQELRDYPVLLKLALESTGGRGIL